MIEENLQRRVADVWGPTIAAHLDHVRRSALPLILNDWLWRGAKYRAMLGRTAYLDFVVGLIERADPADLEAAAFDLADPTGAHASLLIDYEPPGVVLARGPAGGHVAVLWSEDGPGEGYLLWLDGGLLDFPAAVPAGVCDSLNPHWIDERFLALSIAGPAVHPAQQGAIGSRFGRIRGVAIVDAERRAVHVLQPQADEAWTAPRVEARGDEWWLYRDGQAPTPDRRLPRQQFAFTAEPFIDRVHASGSDPRDAPDAAAIARDWDAAAVRHRDALRRAPEALIVHAWLRHKPDYLLALGEAGYRRALTGLLANIEPAERLALGLPDRLDA